VSTTEELLGRKVVGPVYKTENTVVGVRHPSIRKKLAITSPTNGGRSVGIVRPRTQTMELTLTKHKAMQQTGLLALYGQHSIRWTPPLITGCIRNVVSWCRQYIQDGTSVLVEHTVMLVSETLKPTYMA
jgi:hypothetical protein